MTQSMGLGKRQTINITGKLRVRFDMRERAKNVLETFNDKDKNLGKLLEHEVYGMGTGISIIVARFGIAGWCLIVTHLSRWPSWSELTYARHELIPEDVNVAIPFPSDDKYIPLHRYSIVMFEVQPKTSRLIVEAPDVSSLSKP